MCHWAHSTYPSRWTLQSWLTPLLAWMWFPIWNLNITYLQGRHDLVRAQISSDHETNVYIHLFSASSLLASLDFSSCVRFSQFMCQLGWSIPSYTPLWQFGPLRTFGQCRVHQQSSKTIYWFKTCSFPIHTRPMWLPVTTAHWVVSGSCMY